MRTSGEVGSTGADSLGAPRPRADQARPGVHLATAADVGAASIRVLLAAAQSRHLVSPTATACIRRVVAGPQAGLRVAARSRVVGSGEEGRA